MNRPHYTVPVIRFFVLLVTLGVLVGVSRAETPVDSTFAEVEELRAQGQFDQAIERLAQIIEEHKLSSDVLRRAYNDLVFTRLLKRNDAEKSEYDRLQDELIASSREALQTFPDLEPDPIHPPEMKTIYDLQRNAMFGGVEVTANVDSCRVFLISPGGSEAGSYRGMTPLTLKYVPVGDYQLTVARSGYQDRVSPLTVNPSAVIVKEVSLSQERTKKWWLTRVVAPVALVGGIVAGVLMNGDDTPTDTTQPLDGPPPPPAR